MLYYIIYMTSYHWRPLEALTLLMCVTNITCPPPQARARARGDTHIQRHNTHARTLCNERAAVSACVRGCVPIVFTDPGPNNRQRPVAACAMPACRIDGPVAWQALGLTSWGEACEAAVARWLLSLPLCAVLVARRWHQLRAVQHWQQRLSGTSGGVGVRTHTLDLPFLTSSCSAWVWLGVYMITPWDCGSGTG